MDLQNQNKNIKTLVLTLDKLFKGKRKRRNVDMFKTKDIKYN